MRPTLLLCSLAAAGAIGAPPVASRSADGDTTPVSHALAPLQTAERDDVPSPPRPARPSRSVRRQLDAVRRATARFHDPSAAVLAGYRLIPGRGCVASRAGVMGMHFVNIAHLLDAGPDPLRPDYLMYVPAPGGGFRLAAVEYEQSYVGQPPPELFGEAFDGPMAGHVPGQATHYDLHVWVHSPNPSGVFARYNPALTCCPDGCRDPKAPFLGAGTVTRARAHAGGRVDLTLAWTHPDAWARMDTVSVALRAGGRTIGRVEVDEESGAVRARGRVSIVRASRVTVSGPGGRRGTVELSVRVPRQLAGRMLRADLTGRADDGGVQRFERLAAVRVR